MYQQYIDNPLQNFQFPFAELIKPYLEPFLTSNQLGHVDLVLLAFTFYHAVFLASRLLFNKENTKVRNDAAMHVVSFVQAIIICYLSLTSHWATFDEFTTSEERLFKTTPYQQLVCAFAMGYFIWDALVSVFYSTLPFVLHGLVSCMVFSVGLQPYIGYYGPVFLLFELSNPFLNIRWFLMKFKIENTTLKLVNDVVLILMFFGARICWGWWQIGCVIRDFYQHWGHIPVYSSALIVVGNLVLDCLNVVWFWKMLSVAIKIITKGDALEKKTK